jgi:hypothetical protein
MATKDRWYYCGMMSDEEHILNDIRAVWMFCMLPLFGILIVGLLSEGLKRVANWKMGREGSRAENEKKKATKDGEKNEDDKNEGVGAKNKGDGTEIVAEGKVGNTLSDKNGRR